MSGCTPSAVHGSVGDNLFGPSFATTFFRSEGGSEPMSALTVAVTADVGCGPMALTEGALLENLPPPWWRLSLSVDGGLLPGSSVDDGESGEGFFFSLLHQKQPEDSEELDPSDGFYAVAGSMEVVEFEQGRRLRLRGSVELVESEPGEPDDTHDQVNFDIDAVWCEQF